MHVLVITILFIAIWIRQLEAGAIVTVYNERGCDSISKNLPFAFFREIINSKAFTSISHFHIYVIYTHIYYAYIDSHINANSYNVRNTVNIKFAKRNIRTTRLLLYSKSVLKITATNLHCSD